MGGPSVRCLPAPLGVLAALTMTAFCGCGIPVGGTGDAKQDAAERAREAADEARWKQYEEQTSVIRKRIEASARKPEFAEVVRLVERETGARAEPLELEEPFTGGVGYKVPAGRFEQQAARWQGLAAAKGCFLFRLENHFGIGGEPDLLGLLPTTDAYEVILVVGTSANGLEYRGKVLLTPDIVAWLKQHAQEQPFQITGVGLDFIEGWYLTPIKDPRGLAAKIYEFCPDVVDQGTGTVERLADELKTRKLFFWWD